MIVSVCVVAYNEEKVLGKLLEDIQAQDYDHEKMEILLIDSMSTDHTRDIMEKFRETEKSFLKISVFSNEKKKLAPGWNVALKNYIGDAIIRIDAHATIPNNFIRKNVEILESGESVCGGIRPNIIDEHTPWKDTLLLAEQSMFGSSIAPYRSGKKKTYVKSLFHGAYRREVFDKIGFYNEELGRTEDNEIHYRMRKAGYKLCFDPDIISYQYTRSSLKAMLKQKYANGYWIGKTSKVCPKCLSIYHFVPFAFVSAIIASGSVIGATGLAECIKKRHNHTLGKGISALRKVTVVLTTVMWVLYALMASGMAAVSAFKAEDKRNITNACLPVLFLLLHLSYGIGTIAGLMDKSKRG